MTDSSRPWLLQPGYDSRRNMKGNPKGRSLNNFLQIAVEGFLKTSEGERITYKEALVRVLLRKALAGESWAHNLIWDRIEGRVPLPLALSARPPEAEPIAAEIVSDLDKISQPQIPLDEKKDDGA